jgi:hypothetical protein
MTIIDALVGHVLDSPDLCHQDDIIDVIGCGLSRHKKYDRIAA